MIDGPWTLIANPAAGGGRGRRVAEHGRRRLRQAGLDVTLAWTQGRGQARELAAAAIARGCPVVVVCGGDGTVAEVLPELAGQGTSLGLLPAGTCNDLARALGIPGSAERAVRVRGDFGVREQEVFLAATANTPFYGGGMRICPGADPADGSLDLCLVDGSVSPRAVLAMLPRIFRGGHVRSPAVRMLRSSWVELEPLDGGPMSLRADGEHLADAPSVLHVEPRALKVIQPASP